MTEMVLKAARMMGEQTLAVFSTPPPRKYVVVVKNADGSTHSYEEFTGETDWSDAERHANDLLVAHDPATGWQKHISL